jgi:hypothetical protein
MTIIEKLREELIKVAEHPDQKTITYGELAGRVKGIKVFPPSNNPYYDMLIDISESEMERGRPPLSSLVVQKASGEPGDRFYTLFDPYTDTWTSEKKREVFRGWSQQTFAFWSAQRSVANAVDFFHHEELLAFNEVAGLAYDKESTVHAALEEQQLRPLMEKLRYWLQALADRFPEFTTQVRYDWQNGTDFKKYLWARLFRTGDDPDKLFFVVSVNGEYNALIYRLYYMNEGRSQPLSAHHQELVELELPKAAKAVMVSADSLVEYDWARLINESSAFIHRYLRDYDRIQLLLQDCDHAAVEHEEVVGTLAETTGPEGITGFPKRDPKFIGRDSDYETIQRERDALGLAGEVLVIEAEKRKLRKDENINWDKVQKKKDGEGYDVASWDESGEELYIEVKTTTRGINTPFYLSRNELDFAERHADRYVIYRVYEYSLSRKTGKFYVVKNVANSIVKEATVFKCLPKKVS